MNLLGLIAKAQSILNSLIPVMVGLGLVYFIWGVVQYVIADAEEVKKTGKNRIIYGIIGFAVIVGLWGLVNIVANTFSVGDKSAPALISAGGCNTAKGILDLSGVKKGEEFQHVAGYINCVIRDAAIPFLFAVGLLIFIWGVVKFFFVNSDEEAKRTEGKRFMIWGIISLTVMLCVWGLVKIVGSTVGINTNTLPYTQE